jgi:hypothetical protein
MLLVKPVISGVGRKVQRIPKRGTGGFDATSETHRPKIMLKLGLYSVVT